MHARQKQKLSAELTRSITVYVVDKLSGYSKEFQQIMFEKFLGYLENLKDGLSTHLVGQHHSKLLVAKDNIFTLATS